MLLVQTSPIVRRSAAGVASCKEVLGLMRARQATEEAYGQALLKQGRSATITQTLHYPCTDACDKWNASACTASCTGQTKRMTWTK